MMASTKKITQNAETRKNARNISHKTLKKGKGGRRGVGHVKNLLHSMPSGSRFIKIAVLFGFVSFLVTLLYPFTLLILKQNFNINLLETTNETTDVTRISSIERAWNQLATSFIGAKRRVFGDERLQPILNGFLKIEAQTETNKDVKVALGFGACADLLVDGVKTFKKAKVPKKPHPHSNIETMEQMLELFTYYFEHGVASERYIHSKSVYKELLRWINESNAKFNENVGSNAALMSVRFAKEGVKNILLGAQVAAETRARIPKQIQITGPNLEHDDYHVLLEFKAGSYFGKYRSPRDNRLIIHSDDNNAKLQSRAFFFEQLPSFRPDLLVITGLHMLDNSHVEFETRSKVIQDLATDLAKFIDGGSTSSKPMIHFEMASYTEAKLLNTIVDEIFPFVDSYGMNEQEVENLLSLLKSGTISYASNPFPRIARVLDDMRELYTLLAFTGTSSVSRIHVHTLAYQVVMVRLNENGQPIWPRAKESMTKASLTAIRHTCNVEEINLATTKILLDDSFMTSEKISNHERVYFNYTEPVVCWNEPIVSLNNSTDIDDVQFCLAIGLVCKNVVQTGGAGDNVSASGLVLQI